MLIGFPFGQTWFRSLQMARDVSLWPISLNKSGGNRVHLAGRSGSSLDRSSWRASLLRLLHQLSDRGRQRDHCRCRSDHRDPPGCRLGLDGVVPDHSTFSKNRHGHFARAISCGASLRRSAAARRNSSRAPFGPRSGAAYRAVNPMMAVNFALKRAAAAKFTTNRLAPILHLMHSCSQPQLFCSSLMPFASALGCSPGAERNATRLFPALR